MNKVYFSLTSIGYKFTGVILAISLLILCILLVVNYQEIPIFAIVFVFLVFLFAVFGSVLCFTHRISININKSLLIIANFRKKEIGLDKIIDIKVNKQFSIDPRKYCYIDVLLKEQGVLKISGYSSAFVRKNDVKKTEQIIEKIKELISTTNK